MNKYLEKFLIIAREFGYIFYIKTDEHSCRFNQIFLEDVREEKNFCAYAEQKDLELENFNEFQKWLEDQEFTFCKNYAFNDKFETWERFKDATDNKITIDLVGNF